MSEGEVWVGLGGLGGMGTAPPAPAMARPAIRAVDVGATPQINEPNSKTETANRNVHLILNTLYTFPNVGCSAVLNPSDPNTQRSGIYVVRKNAEAYQPTSSRVLK
jgi:hypothetical protein